MQKRDYNVLSHIKREISLSTRIKRDKNKYNRKAKQSIRMRRLRGKICVFNYFLRYILTQDMFVIKP